MPRSRRSKVGEYPLPSILPQARADPRTLSPPVSLTKTAKKSLDDKKHLVESVRASVDAYKYVWLFSVGDMRNDSLKEIRREWKG